MVFGVVKLLAISLRRITGHSSPDGERSYFRWPGKEQLANMYGKMWYNVREILELECSNN